MEIHEYGIIKDSVVLMVHRVLGGYDPRAEARKRKCNLTDFQNQIETTSEPCMISLDDDLATKRARMPCGHVISE